MLRTAGTASRPGGTGDVRDGTDTMNLKVVIEEDTEDGGYVVSCPALPGCHSQGETVEEALANIQDAIRGCIEALNDRAARAGGATVLDVTV